MTADRESLRVLAVTPDNHALRQLRLEMPLSALKRLGLIQDYFITSEHLSDLPDEYTFDAVWLQRVERVELIEHLGERIDGNYLYDIDDLLIGTPSYTRVPHGHGQGALKALQSCSFLTTTSNRALSFLEEYSGVALKHKAGICRNGFEFFEGLRTPKPPESLVWTSSDYAALINSREPVVNAISRFSEKYGLPVYCFGRLNRDIKERLRNTVDMGLVSFWRHKAFLGSLPVSIGVAPLETNAGKVDLDFINAKSDLKMVEFGGFGHPSVYSAAPPYTDTDLRSGVVVENDEKAWLDGLEMIYREGWKHLAREQADIVERRRMRRIAIDCWADAVSRVRLRRSMRGDEIKFPRRFGSRFAERLAGAYENSRFLQGVVDLIPKPAARILRSVLLGK